MFKFKVVHLHKNRGKKPNKNKIKREKALKC